MDFLKYFDGTGRKPRDVQVEALTWLQQNWNQNNTFCISAPVAAGKSALAKAIAYATGGHVITPTNLLVSQYIETYPTNNALKGKAHYFCSPQMSCYDWVNVCEQAPCESCPYIKAKQRALEEPTFFNPMSYWYFTQPRDFEPPPVLIVDEAHTLVSSLLLICGLRLRRGEYVFPADIYNEMVLIKWMDETIEKLNKLKSTYKDDKVRMLAVSDEIRKFRFTAAGLRENPQNFAIWTEPGKHRGKKDTFLHIKPLTVPDYITRRFFSARKIVLLSGTIMETDVKELLGGRPYAFKDLPSPIPVERRRLHYTPVPFRLNWETPPAKIAAAIEAVVARHPGKNTIVHVSYDMSKKLQPFLKIPFISNTPEDKDARLAEFKEKGGVFLASGCAEGIDLKGDLARVNIVPKLLYPNLADPVVKKRKALEDGEEWFGLVTLRTLIQQQGRTTRTEDDESITYILDPTFSNLYRRWKHKLPNYFKESISWEPLNVFSKL